MKTRKIFLDGYVQYVPKFFRGGNKDKGFAVINKCGRGILVNRFALEKANVDISKPILNADVFVNQKESKFAIVFNEEGRFTLRSYQKLKADKYSAYQMSSSNLIDDLKEIGFEVGVRYNTESPEDGVIIVKRDA